MKRFLEWIGLKEKLHNTKHKAPFVSEREIWWASVGENIGSEINGKSNLFSRPVIILKKLSHGFYLVVPTTSQPREGTWYVSFEHRGIKTVACLHQIRTIDFRRLSSRLGRIDSDDFAKIKTAFNKLYA